MLQKPPRKVRAQKCPGIGNPEVGLFRVSMLFVEIASRNFFVLLFHFLKYLLCCGADHCIRDHATHNYCHASGCFRCCCCSSSGFLPFFCFFFFRLGTADTEIKVSSAENPHGVSQNILLHDFPFAMSCPLFLSTFSILFHSVFPHFLETYSSMCLGR